MNRRIAAMALLNLSATLASCRGQPAIPTIESIIAELTRAQASLMAQPAIYVELLHKREYFSSDGEQPPDYTPKRVVMARSGGAILIRQSNAEGDPDTSWYAWKDGIGVERHEQGLTIYPEPPISFMNLNHYWDNVFVNIFRGLNLRGQGFVSPDNPDGALDRLLQATVLPDCLAADPSKWTVEPEQITVDNHKCVVVTRDGLDTFWLDPNCRYACRRRELKNENGELIRRWENREYREIAPNLWLPLKQSRAFYNDPETRQISGKLRLKEDNAVVKVSFAPLPDSFFDVPIPEQNGAVIDLVRDMQYELHPHELTDDELRQRALQKAKNQLVELAPWQPGVLAWVILIVVLGLSVVSIVWRRRA